MNEAAESETSRGEQVSGLARYDKRIEELVEAFSDQVERVGGQALEELAATRGAVMSGDSGWPGSGPTVRPRSRRSGT